MCIWRDVRRLLSQLFIYKHSDHYYQRQLTDYRELITINYNFPSYVFLSSPYFTHDASCVMLNTDWTLLSCLV